MGSVIWTVTVTKVEAPAGIEEGEALIGPTVGAATSAPAVATHANRQDNNLSSRDGPVMGKIEINSVPD